MRETIIEGQEISLHFHPEHKIVHHEIHRAARGEPFRNALMRGAELMAEHGGCKWLSDDRRYFVLPEEDEEWATGTWFPRVKEAGWKYWAVVKPEVAIAELNVARFIKMYEEKGIKTILVSDYEAAWKWLTEQGE